MAIEILLRRADGDEHVAYLLPSEEADLAEISRLKNELHATDPPWTESDALRIAIAVGIRARLDMLRREKEQP